MLSIGTGIFTRAKQSAQARIHKWRGLPAHGPPNPFPPRRSVEFGDGAVDEFLSRYDSSADGSYQYAERGSNSRGSYQSISGYDASSDTYYGSYEQHDEGQWMDGRYFSGNETSTEWSAVGEQVAASDPPESASEERGGYWSGVAEGVGGLVVGVAAGAALAAISPGLGAAAAIYGAVAGGLWLGNRIAEQWTGVDAASGATLSDNELNYRAGQATVGILSLGLGLVKPTVNGRGPVNGKYAGDTHSSGIKFNENGFPDFKPVAVAEVQLEGLTGNYAKDSAMANRAVGLAKTPEQYVWHHVEDQTTMQLVSRSIHRATGHTGGAALIRNGGFDR